MPRICHITSSHPVDDARVLDRELLSLRKRYDDVHFVGCTDVPEQEERGVTIHGIGDRVEPRQRRGQLKRLFEIALSLKADIYHCHEPDSLWVALKLKKRLDVPVIYDAHELSHAAYAHSRPGLTGRLLGGIIRVVTARLAARCDWLITVSPGLGKYYGPLVDDRMTLIYNSSPMENFTDWESKPGDPQMVIYHEGTLQRGRDLEGILTVLKRLRRDLPVTLRCLGGVARRDQDLYDRTVAELDLKPEAVDLVPFMPYADVCGVLCQGLISLSLPLPLSENLKRSLPNKLFNSMAAGACLVVSDTPDQPSIVEQCDSGLIVPAGDRDALEEALRRLVTGPDEARRMGLNGRRAMENEFGWFQMEKRLYEIYDRLLGSSGTTDRPESSGSR